MSEPRPILYLDSDDLNSKVLAGDSAYRTVKLLQKQLTPCQFSNLIYFLGEAEKEARRLEDSARIATFRAGVLAEAKRHEYLGGPPPPTVAPKPKPKVNLAEDFGV